MACRRKPKTPLAEYAKSLRQEKASELGMAFPMYVVSLQNMLDMTEVKRHQELLRDGVLTEMDAACGKAMFLSHQWTSNQHPDPDGKQLKVFQAAMSNLASGSIVAQPSAFSASAQYLLGYHISLPDLSANAIFVWYDYFSVPQYTVTAWSRSVSGNLFEDQRNAIASIPAYIDKCDFFVVLCPLMRHATTHLTLNFESWAERGWCRTEAMTRNLSVKNASMLVIEGPRQVTVGSTWHSTFLAPGDAKYTVDHDREVVAEILKQMVRKKLHSLLVKGDLPGYRLLLNQQQVWLRKSNTAPVPGLLAGDLRTDSDQMGDVGEEFLFQHGFSKLCECDEAGWSPLCYAALGGNPQVLEALLSKRANPNETLRRSCPILYLQKGDPVLAICGRFGNKESIGTLLRAQADPNKQDHFGMSPLFHVATYSDNVDGARLLLEAHADPRIANRASLNAFQYASIMGASKIAKELLQFPGGDASRQELLHQAIFFSQGFQSSAVHISLLLQSGCDINEQLRFDKVFPGVHLLLGLLALKHCLSAPTLFNTFAYHWRDATPLMVSILVRNYSISRILLEARARIDLRNSRKQTAFDLAIKQGAPDALLWDLWRRGAGNHASQASISWWHSNTPEEDSEDQMTLITVDSSIPVEMLQDPDPMVSMQFWCEDIQSMVFTDPSLSSFTMFHWQSLCSFKKCKVLWHSLTTNIQNSWPWSTALSDCKTTLLASLKLQNLER